MIRNQMAFEPLEARQLLSAGDLDAFFGGTGTAFLENTPGITDSIADAAGDSQGRVIAVGTTRSDAGRRMAIWRFRPDGTPDDRFGIGGRVEVTPHGAAFANQIAVLPDDSFYVLGRKIGSPELDFVTHFSSSGKIDRAFARRGSLGIGITARDMTLEADGDILISGNSKAGLPPFEAAATRLKPSGAIDTTFGDGGVILDGLGGNNRFSFWDAGTDDAGRIYFAMVETDQSDPTDVVHFVSVHRRLADGTIDSSYGVNGTSTIGIGETGFSAPKIDVFANGRVALLERGGVRVLPPEGEGLGITLAFNEDLPLGGGTSLAAQSDGKSLVGGFLPTDGTTLPRPALLRLNPDLTVDTSYGTNGLVEIDFSVTSLSITPDGSTLLTLQEGTGDDAAFGVARVRRDAAPMASLSTSNIRVATSRSHRFELTLRDEDAIDVTTLDRRDLRITGPNGFVRYALFKGFRSSDGGRVVVATYKTAAPGGIWDAGEHGEFFIRLRGEADGVSDADGNFTTSRTLGSFTVAT